MDIYIVTFFGNIVGVFSSYEIVQEAIKNMKVKYPKTLSPWRICVMKLNELKDMEKYY